jgi:peptide/nickel transport system ATP-binding protein/oligopeptide transport system ATP-binding protein
MIAMAIAGEPSLLVADEPTTALDVTVQAQILELLRNLQREIGMGILFVTHDLGLVAEVADRVAVMYAGRLAELAPARELFDRPRHPYTRGLLDSLPFLDDDIDRLKPIDGTVPSLKAMPVGCAFAPRCPQASELCRHSDPETVAIGGGGVACHHPLRTATEAA